MPKPRSFRLREELLAALEERARERGESTSALVERYLDEGLRLEGHPLITFRDGAAGRRPALAGTRIDVAQVIDTFEQSRKNVADTAAHLALPEPYVRAAIRYYADYRVEVDAWRE